MKEIKRAKYHICENCPKAAEIEAAARASKRLQKEGLFSDRMVRFGEAMREMHIVALQETCKTHSCPGVKQDEDGTPRCPQPVGRVGFLVSGDDVSNVNFANQIAGRTGSVGF